MQLQWTSKGESDLARLYDFLALVNRPSVERTVRQLTAAPVTLLMNPRIDERLDEYEPRDVCRLSFGHYEFRYEIIASTVYVVRIWNTREYR